MHDIDVLQRAVADSRWILTFDLDYGELVFRRHLDPPPAIVLFRLSTYGLLDPGRRALELLASPEAGAGGFFVIETGGQRYRPLLAK